MKQVNKPLVAALSVALTLVAAPAAAATAAPDVHPWLLTVADMPKGWVTGSFVPGFQFDWAMMTSSKGSPAPGSAAQAIFTQGRYTFFWEILGSWPTSGGARARVGLPGAEPHTVIPNLGHFGSESSAGYQYGGYRYGWYEDVVVVQKGRALAMLCYMVESSPTAAHKSVPATTTFRSLIRLTLAKIQG